MPVVSNIYNKYVAHVSPAITALFVLISISFTGKVSLTQPILLDLAQELNGNSTVTVIAGSALLIFFLLKWDIYREYRSKITRILASLFSLFTIIGISYAANDNWSFLFASKGQLAIALLAFIGYFFLFDFLVSQLFYLLDIFHDAIFEAQMHGHNLIKRHPFIFAFCIIGFAWLPYLIFNLPGSVPYDGYRQINMGLGYEAISQHHPWLLSYAFAFIMRIGQLFSDNMGVFLITTCLFLVELFCYSSTCSSLYKMHAPQWLYIFSIGFFALVPAFGAYAQVVMKDGLYSALFALWFINYIKMFVTIKQHRQIQTSAILATAIVGLLVCLTRNNGIYVIIPAYIVLLFFSKGSRAINLTAIIAVCAIYLLLNNVVAPALGVQPGPTKEILSLPFQQTARYLRDYPNDVTVEEAKAISSVLDYKHLGDMYVPERSDPVKDSFASKSTKRDLVRYFKAWLLMGLRHPDAYLQATFNNTFGYFYPSYNYTELGPYQFYIQGEPIATGDLDIHYLLPENIRGICSGWAQLWRNLPVLNLLVSPGAHTWLLLLCAGYLVRERRSAAILPLVALFLNVAVCCVSPVNGYLRYALPLIACTPALLYWTLIASRIPNNGSPKHQRSLPADMKKPVNTQDSRKSVPAALSMPKK